MQLRSPGTLLQKRMGLTVIEASLLRYVFSPQRSYLASDRRIWRPSSSRSMTFDVWLVSRISICEGSSRLPSQTPASNLSLEYGAPANFSEQFGIRIAVKSRH
jgi:hypothetical protein